MGAGGLFGGVASQAPWSARVCDGVAIALALWTVICHGVVFAGGNLHHLIALYALGVVALVATLWWLRRRATGPDRDPDSEPEIATATPDDGDWAFTLRLAGGVAALVVALLLDPASTPVAVWWTCIVVLGLALVRFGLGKPSAEIPPVRGRRTEAVLWSIALACLCVALVVHRPDLDDTFYVNVAVAAADTPERALLSGDTLHGVAELPLHMPAHRLHTWELWNGALSYLTGVPAIYCFHWISAAWIALLIPLAHARLFRQLTPRHWIQAVGAVVVVLLASGETHRSYGNFALVRVWQGKAVYLYFFMPLVYAYGLRFARDPNARHWLMLAAAQIGAVGSSSSAVWAAPAGAFMALACGLQPSLRGLRVFAIGALASVYVLVAGFVLKGELAPLLADAIAPRRFGAPFDSALSHVFGSRELLRFGLFAIAGTWACWGPGGLARRFAIVFPLGVLAILLNPYWDHLVASHVTGPAYWRAMWSLPAPVLMALLVVAPLQFHGGRRVRVARSVATAALGATFVYAIPSYTTLSSQNPGAGGVGIRLGVPSVKAPRTPYHWARKLVESVPPGSIVVAPPNVSAWVPTFHHGAFPLQARRMYLDRQRANLGQGDTDLRKWMTLYAGGDARSDRPHVIFKRGLDHYGVAGVCLRKSAYWEETKGMLKRIGFRKVVSGHRFEIWVREAS